MKADDPRLEKSRKEAVERSRKMSALTLAVIRGHLILEQAMDEFLEHRYFIPNMSSKVASSFCTRRRCASR